MDRFFFVESKSCEFIIESRGKSLCIQIIKWERAISDWFVWEEDLFWLLSIVDNKAVHADMDAIIGNIRIHVYIMWLSLLDICILHSHHVITNCICAVIASWLLSVICISGNVQWY
jgi:hypothetical protein